MLPSPSVSELPEAFYLQSSPGRYEATAYTRGPWSDTLQHGGPPSALLAGAMARDGEGPEVWHLARLTVSLLRPVPIGPVRVQTTARRRGRAAEHLEAELLDDDARPLAHATAVRIRRSTVTLPPAKDPPAPSLPAVDTLPSFTFPFFTAAVAYHRAVEVRVARGRWGHEPTAAWLRPRVPLVHEQPMLPLEALTIVSDAANGVSMVLPVQRYQFINPDLTLALARPCRGRWFGLDTHAVADAGGTGLCQAELHDELGPFGRSLQTLVVRPVQTHEQT